MGLNDSFSFFDSNMCDAYIHEKGNVMHVIILCRVFKVSPKKHVLWAKQSDIYNTKEIIGCFSWAYVSGISVINLSARISGVARFVRKLLNKHKNEIFSYTMHVKQRGARTVFIEYLNNMWKGIFKVHIIGIMLEFLDNDVKKFYHQKKSQNLLKFSEIFQSHLNLWSRLNFYDKLFP